MQILIQAQIALRVVSSLPALGGATRFANIEDKVSSGVDNKVQTGIARAAVWQPIKGHRTRAKTKRSYRIWVNVRRCQVEQHNLLHWLTFSCPLLVSSDLGFPLLQGVTIY